MANETGSKSEKASGQKLKKAREKGQIPRSRDLSVALGLLIALKLIIILGSTWQQHFYRIFLLSFVELDGDTGLEMLGSFSIRAAISLFIWMLLPLLVIPLLIVFGSLYPGGWAMTIETVRPKLSRFNPITNLGRLFTLKHYGTFFISVAKVATIIFVLWALVSRAMPHFLQLQDIGLPNAVTEGSRLITGATEVMIAVLLVFACIDAPFQKLIFLRDQRMTKKEVKDEHRHSEGTPEVKGRIRQLQRQAAQRGLNRVIPEADVVLLNPTHYAVAIKYDAARADAPFVVAKGLDEMAVSIGRLARLHKVEVLCLPPLTRAIYHTSQVNQQIPNALYQAVAQVLTYVMQLRAFRDGQRQVCPDIPTHIDIPDTLSKH